MAGVLSGHDHLAQQGTSFPDSLAHHTAEICRRLAHERELHFEKLLSDSARERETLRAENAQLREELHGRLSEVGNAQSLVMAQTTTGIVACVGNESRQVEPSSGRRNNTRWWEASRSPSGNSDGPWADYGLASGDADHFTLRKAFKVSDGRKLHRICAEDVVHRMAQSDGLSRLVSITRVRKAFDAVNALMAERLNRKEPSQSLSLDSYEKEVPAGELSFEGFKMLVVQDLEAIAAAAGNEELVSAEVAATVKEVREFYIKYMADQMIMEKTRVKKSELNKQIEASTLPWWLEPVVGTVILTNAVTIGISQDTNPGALVWKIIEAVCAVFFALEIVVKVRYDGCREFCFGISWSWNWFDLGIVVLAVLDIIFEILISLSINGLPNFGGVSIVRLVRLLRIARLVRLLRMKFFKELTLMVNGVLSGLKTLMWAFVFLFTLVYVLGVLMKQLLDPDLVGCSIASGTSVRTCSASETLLLDSNELLFSTVFRSMFTVFRCLTGDCSGPEGYPLAPHVMEYLGDTFILSYFVVNCFVLFGVFNLVMAIFVENTLEAARVNQQKRHALKQQEDIRVAQELREIVLRICTRPVEPQAEGRPQTPLSRRSRPASSGPVKFFWSLVYGSESPKEHNAPEELEEETMHMVVTREVFQEVLEDPKTLAILEDLEIPITNHDKLFDIIDSNGSGQLDIPEIIDGLMKLRGPADKGDLVCAALMVRSVQRELKRLENDITHRHTQTLSALEILQIQSTSIQTRLDGGASLRLSEGGASPRQSLFTQL